MTSQSIPLIKQLVALIRLKPFHIFSPTGITFGYILSQSHLVIHTYPEEGVIHVDLAICSDRSQREFENSLKCVLSGHGDFSIEVKTLEFKG